MTLQELNEHLELKQKLDKVEAMYHEMEMRAYPGSPRLDGMPHGSGVSDKVGALGIELADLSARKKFLKAEVEKSEIPVAAYINTIEDDMIRLIFRLRFIHGYIWKDVADIVGGRNTEDSVRQACYRYLAS